MSSSQARVTSLEAIESFRAHLLTFMQRSRLLVDEVSADTRRTKGWLQNDRRPHWEREIRRRQRLLSQAEQELYSAKLSAFRVNTQQHEVAVRRAKVALEEAETKLRNTKQWTRNFESVVDPKLRALESFRGLLDGHLPKGASFLHEIQTLLEDYAGTRPTGSLPEQPPENPPTEP